LVSVDFLVVPTVSFRILYGFLVLAHERRRVVHFNVTEHPTAEWTAEQLVQAFPWDTAPRYLPRDRDRIYGEAFRIQAANTEIGEVLTAPRSPWQTPYVERLIGSLHRECLDHIIVNESRPPDMAGVKHDTFLRLKTRGHGLDSSKFSQNRGAPKKSRIMTYSDRAVH
jgi:hypothetical protein